MGHSVFGWSYPPGCSGPPGDDYVPSKESEEAYVLLENAEVDQGIIDKVCEIVDRLADRQCAECIRRQNEAEAKFDAEMTEVWKENISKAAPPRQRKCPHCGLIMAGYVHSYHECQEHRATTVSP
jgi:hypothetical protein